MIVSTRVCIDIFIIVAQWSFDLWIGNCHGEESYWEEEKKKSMTQRPKAMNNLNSRTICYTNS